MHHDTLFTCKVNIFFAMNRFTEDEHAKFEGSQLQGVYIDLP